VISHFQPAWLSICLTSAHHKSDSKPLWLQPTMFFSLHFVVILVSPLALGLAISSNRSLPLGSFLRPPTHWKFPCRISDQPSGSFLPPSLFRLTYAQQQCASLPLRPHSLTAHARLHGNHRFVSGTSTRNSAQTGPCDCAVSHQPPRQSATVRPAVWTCSTMICFSFLSLWPHPLRSHAILVLVVLPPALGVARQL
jgi:hypothetical protein